MDMSFYTAAVGAYQQQLRLDVHSNNMANVNTNGFRARRPSFSALMTQQIQGVTEDVRRGAGARLEAAESTFDSNGLKGTDRWLDCAIEGDGFFALLDPTTGEFTYTRDGSFVLSDFHYATGEQTEEEAQALTGEDDEIVWYLSDGLGRFVLGQDGRPLEVTNERQTLNVGVFDFVNRDGIKSLYENRFVPVDKNGQVAPGTGKVVQGYLELSNADLAYELSKVIESQRSFQYTLRMVRTSDEITTTVNGLR